MNTPITGAPTCAPVSQSRFGPSLTYTQHDQIPALVPQGTLRDVAPIYIDESGARVLAAALRRFDRTHLDCAIEVLIAVLDATDGDPDAESGNDLEDDFALSPRAIYIADGPGCGIGDPGAQCSEDEISCGSSGIYDQGAGCALSDPGGGGDEAATFPREWRIDQTKVVRLEGARAKRAEALAHSFHAPSAVDA